MVEYKLCLKKNVKTVTALVKLSWIVTIFLMLLQNRKHQLKNVTIVMELGKKVLDFGYRII